MKKVTHRKRHTNIESSRKREKVRMLVCQGNCIWEIKRGKIIR